MDIAIIFIGIGVLCLCVASGIDSYRLSRIEKRLSMED